MRANQRYKLVNAIYICLQINLDLINDFVVQFAGSFAISSIIGSVSKLK